MRSGHIFLSWQVRVFLGGVGVAQIQWILTGLHMYNLGFQDQGNPDIGISCVHLQEQVTDMKIPAHHVGSSS